MGGVSNDRAKWLAEQVFPHEPAIRLWLRRRTAVGLEIDDVIHEMYAKLVQLPSVSQIDSPKRYAYRIAHSIIVDHLRRTKIVSMTTLTGEMQSGLATSEPSIEERLADRSMLQDVYSVLDGLPALCRQAFLLRRVDGLSQREVAQKLSISEKTVEKYMTRSIRLIVETFGRGGKRPSQSSYQQNSQTISDGNRSSGDR